MDSLNIIKKTKEILNKNLVTNIKKSEKIHIALSKAVMEEIADVWNETEQKHCEVRRAYYFSAEFLVGRAIFNNLICLGIYDEIKLAFQSEGYDISNLEEVTDAALGNGGLGRLAACFLDSASSLKIPLDGYGIRYKYGLFKQTFKDGCQKEEADDWNSDFDPWSIRKEDDAVEVKFSGQTVVAVPYDMPIIGYRNNNINTLRLWQAEAKNKFNFEAFNNFDYEEAFREDNEAKCISAVLYPNDDMKRGKILRLKQQYFFCSASLQDIIKKFKLNNGSNFEKFPQEIAIQLNDTHPVISIAELVRLLCVNENIPFVDSLDIAKKVFSYTNHTIMAEALETWPTKLVEEIIPDVFYYILKIEEDFKKTMINLKVDKKVVENLDIIKKDASKGDVIHMANLAVYATSYTNGVSQLHTDILKNSCLKDWYSIYPNRFQNKTNGITQRRWLLLCNQELSRFITNLLKSDSWITDLYKLKELDIYSNNEEVIKSFIDIKRVKRQQLVNYIEKQEGVSLDVNTIFDVQAKRLHEYKRQLLNILSILDIYFKIKSGKIKNFYPTTFLFGAKAAPGYKIAKQIIELINSVANFINKDNELKDIIRVFFVQNYNVSYAEKIIAAANVSEQISTAGTEASGTGNMKFMLNGAVTLGTYDGANIEIVQEAGEANNYIFGNTKEQIDVLKENYNPVKIYNENDDIKQVIDALTNGMLGNKFVDLKNSLLKGSDWQPPDQYFVLADFEDYIKTKLKVNEDYKDSINFYKKCWKNICGAGKFSSDRTIKDYSDNIWHIKPI